MAETKEPAPSWGAVPDEHRDDTTWSKPEKDSLPPTDEPSMSTPDGFEVTNDAEDDFPMPDLDQLDMLGLFT
jgi:hypothetical protein